MSDPLDSVRKVIGYAPPKEPVKRPDPRSAQKCIVTWHSPEVRKQLKVISANTGKSQQQLIAELLNKLFIDHGMPPIAR